jgi:hypothetical protein
MEEQREKLKERCAATVDKAVHLANIDMARPCEKKEDDGPSLVIGKFNKGQDDDCESCELTSGSIYLTDGDCIDVHSNNFKYLGFDGENDIYEYQYDSITSDGGCELKTGYFGIPCPVKHYESWPSPVYRCESEDDESSGPPSLVPRRDDLSSDDDDESVDEWYETMGLEEKVTREDESSVHTMTAAELLMNCATMDTGYDLEFEDKEVEDAIKDLDSKPPYMCTRSKADMTREEIKEVNKMQGRKIRDDSKFEKMYKDAERLQKLMAQHAKTRAEAAKKYGVDDLEEYLQQRAVEWGYERVCEAENLADEKLAEDEEIYFKVKPKKRGINKLVRVVHKRNKSM